MQINAIQACSFLMGWFEQRANVDYLEKSIEFIFFRQCTMNIIFHNKAFGITLWTAKSSR